MTEALSPLKRFLLTLALGSAAFMQVLDTSIANVSIPYIAGDLGVSDNTGTWVITLFAVGNAIALPLTGWLSKVLGEVKLMMLSILLFTFLSWLCGSSISFSMLIFCRFLQGFTAGPLIPLAQSLLVKNYPHEKRTFAISLFYMILVVAPVLGPIVGGYITQEYSWPWIFFINLPVGILSSLLAWSVLKDQETKKEPSKVDYGGLILLVLGVSLLQILIDKGEQYDWFRNPAIITMMIVSVMAIAYLIFWEDQSKNPVIRLDFFKNSRFVVGTFLTVIGYMMFFGSFVLTPLWLQDYMGYMPYNAGVAIAPIGILPILLLIPSAILMKKIKAEVLIFVFFIANGLCFFYQSLMTPQVTVQWIQIARLMLGLPLCIFLPPLFAFTMKDVKDQDLPAAAGIYQFFRIFSGGVATSLTLYLWDRRAILHRFRLLEINHYTGPKDPSALSILDEGLSQQAYLLATNDVFYLFAIISFIIAPFILFYFKDGLSVKPDRPLIME